MKRLLAIVMLGVSAGAIFFLGSGASDSTGSSYRVDAEFRNAFSVIPGEDVKIAGVKVGKITGLDVTPRQTASVKMEITQPGFGDWRADAECSIRPQSLIGEKFVECTPTQPRAQGAAVPPLLRTRDDGDGRIAMLPVSQTSRPVDIDLVGNITRLPYRQRLTIILNEFGAGVAGRGKDLAKIIRTADPALKSTDKVLSILSEQDEVLRKLATDSDASLAPLARDRARVTDFVTQSGKVAKATADRRVALEANIQKLPRFLRELRPTLQQLGSLSDEGTPLLSDLNKSGPDVSRFIKQLGPFSTSATASVTSLGDASVVGRQALNKSRPIIGDLKNFAGSSKVLSTDLRELTESFRDTGGIERLMDYAFYQVSAINGFDQYGHYLRAQLLVNLCSAYSVTSDPACIANFIKPSTNASARAARADTSDPVLARTKAVLRGTSADAIRRADKAAAKRRTAARAAKRAAATTSDAQRTASFAPARTSAASAAAAAEATSAPATAPSASDSPEPNAGVSSLLDYLLGSGS